MKIEKLNSDNCVCGSYTEIVLRDKINEIIEITNKNCYAIGEIAQCIIIGDEVFGKELKDEELLRCPFCGEIPALEYDNDEIYPGYSIQCQNEKCSQYGTRATKEKAIQAWNTRK